MERAGGASGRGAGLLRVTRVYMTMSSAGNRGKRRIARRWQPLLIGLIWASARLRHTVPKILRTQPRPPVEGRARRKARLGCGLLMRLPTATTVSASDSALWKHGDLAYHAQVVVEHALVRVDARCCEGYAKAGDAKRSLGQAGSILWRLCNETRVHCVIW